MYVRHTRPCLTQLGDLCVRVEMTYILSDVWETVCMCVCVCEWRKALAIAGGLMGQWNEGRAGRELSLGVMTG